MNENSCYSCGCCIRDIHDYATWCAKTGKTIDDGFGEGDCSTCEHYIQVRSLYSFSYTIVDEPLPF
ncbi:MAG: hypothetical protein BWY74_03859 [Firmicutes bacterium ADurb.Bin419]|nr:MAG: hypothetical protein BWY74_03859 [Firmicutes bacterium ADurb.Bin419]